MTPQTPPQPAPSSTRVRIGVAFNLIGGLTLLVNGINYFRGAGSNGLSVVGAVFIIAGLGMRGMLNKKL